MFLDVLVQPNSWLVDLTAVVNFYFADYSKNFTLQITPSFCFAE